jgi:hypothetical protein
MRVRYSKQSTCNLGRSPRRTKQASMPGGSLRGVCFCGTCTHTPCITVARSWPPGTARGCNVSIMLLGTTERDTITWLQPQRHTRKMLVGCVVWLKVNGPAINQISGQGSAASSGSFSPTPREKIPCATLGRGLHRRPPLARG